MTPRCEEQISDEEKETLMKAPQFKNTQLWFEYRQRVDGAEGLWRIHDGLYDVNGFIKNHPGGAFWLETTKGTDITELFESHHLSPTPAKLLKKFYVRQAKVQRRSPFTFEENGFYKTVKRNVQGVLRTIPKGATKISDVYTDGLMFLSIVAACLANQFWSYGLMVLSGCLCAMTICAAHNYCHRKDNLRMYYADVHMMPSRLFRTLHILNHHMFPSTYSDITIAAPEPLIVYYPKEKSFLVKYASWFYVPFLLWPCALHVLALEYYVRWLVHGRPQKVSVYDFSPLILPIVMFVICDQTLGATLIMWQLIIAFEGFFFGLLGFTNGHLHPDVFMEGDTPRSKTSIDWGLFQLDTACDRIEIAGNKFIELISFGNHATHHLFPTLDGSILHYLVPIVEETSKHFNVHLQMFTQVEMFKGFFIRLAKVEKNFSPRD